MIRRLLFLLPFLLVFLTQEGVYGQIERNQYGLIVYSDLAAYKKRVAKDHRQELVSLPDVIPGLAIDIRYATANNFMGESMYEQPGAYLRLPAAEALRAVQAELHKIGLGLKVFDAYRPFRVTVAFWNKVKDSVFVASPRRGSRHNRGCAVDLTIINLNSGAEIAMPTAYDDFTAKAHTDYADLPEEVIRNRELLKKVMTKHGFEIYADEWWHYDFNGWDGYPLMDIPFERLKGAK